MKTTLRWIAVLPGAVAAYFLLQILNALAMSFLTNSSDRYIQLFNSFAGPIAFVWCGAKIAPKYEFKTALVLAIIQAIYAIVFITLAFTMKNPSDPAWWITLCEIVGVVAAFGCCWGIREDASPENI